MFSDAIAQCVYSTFICAYPNSWNNFDEGFKGELCMYISLWQVGTRPMPGLWRKWNFALLEPKNLLKRISQDEHTDEVSVDGRSMQTSRGLLTSDRLHAKERKKSEETTQGQLSPLPTSSSQRTLSFGEVKKTLEGSKEALVPLVRHCKGEDQATGKIVPSVSEEKRIGLAREQFKTLQKRSMALPKSSHSGLQQIGPSQAVRSSANIDLENTERRRKSKSDSSVKTLVVWHAAKKDSSIPPQPSQGLSANGQHSPHSDINNPVKAKGALKAKEAVKAKAKGAITKQSESTQVHKPPISKSTRSQQTSLTSSSLPPAHQDVCQATASTTSTKTMDSYQKTCGELKKMALAFKDRPKGDHSAPSMKGPEFEHVLFNLHGHSPLVKHYINHTRLTHINEKESIVGRTEVSTEPEKAVCYQDVLAESKKSSDRNHAMFQK